MKIDLEAFVYTREKKGDIKRMRKNAKIPGVVYGHKDKPKRIYVPEKEFKKVLEVLKKEVVTINLKVEDKHYPCLIKSVQHNPMTGNLLHVDFQHISKKEKIKATIPLHILGEAPGVKEGGVLDQHLREVVVKCLPDDIPSHIDVDISKVLLNHTIHLKDIKPANVDFELGPETAVISCSTPKVEKVVVAPVVEEGAIPVEGAPVEEGKEVKEGKEGKEEKPKEEDKAGKDKAGKDKAVKEPPPKGK
jgi:large subunit ribosomal protein L25